MRPITWAGFPAIVLVAGFGIGRAGAEPADGRAVAVFSELEQPATIVSIVPEGTAVAKGQLVCELDSTILKDRFAEQEIATNKAKTAYQDAKRAREVAEIALTEYIEGIYKQDLQTVLGEIALAESEKGRAKDRLDWSNRMFQKGHFSEGQYIADKVSLQQKVFALEQARTKKDVLEKYTKTKTAKELKSEVEKARSNELAKHAAWELEDSRRTRLGRQISACRLVAPAAGRVVYARPQFKDLPPLIEVSAAILPRQLVFLIAPETAPPGPQAEAPTARPAEVVSEVEGRTVILSIVPEGTVVARGQLVAELDSSALRDRQLNQELATRRAEAAFENSKLTLQAAELALQEYREGIAKQEKAKLQGEIELAKARAALAKDRIEQAGGNSKDSVARKKAELDLKRSQLALKKATDNLKLLAEYTEPRTIKTLECDIGKARADEQARRDAWELEKTKQAKLERQIALCKLVAPEAGRVVYARRPDRPENQGLPPLIEAGAAVRERQVIFRIVPEKTADEAPK
jgi:multidrug resistance efflux pump